MTQPPSSGPLSPPPNPSSQPGPSGQPGQPAAGGMPSPGAPAPQGGGSWQGGYGSSQGGHPAPQGGPGAAPAKKPSKAPKVLIILGSVILALSVIIGVILAVVGFGGVASGAAEFEVFDGGSGTVSAEAGDSLQLYAPEDEPTPQCTIDGPSVGEGTSQSSEFGDGETQWVSFDSFTAEEAGDYDIQCGGTPVMVGPPISIGGIFAGIGGLLLAIGGGALGLLLLAIGVVLVLLRKRRA